MRHRQPPHHEEEGGEEERWLLTYSDMITLLLALFVVLFALSTLNKVKFAEFRTGVRQAFTSHISPLSAASSGLLSQTSLSQRKGKVQGLQPLGPLHPPTTTTTTTAAAPATTAATTPTASATRAAPVAATSDHAQLARLEQAIHAALAKEGLLQDVIINLTKDQLSVQLIADRVFFATNSASLAPIGAEIVDTVGGVLAPAPNSVSVQGYTDDVPVTGGPYYSNFMLSAARATAVVLRLDQQDGVAPGRLRLVGYGPTHPVATNATPAGRARNRRVDVVIMGGAP